MSTPIRNALGCREPGTPARVAGEAGLCRLEYVFQSDRHRLIMWLEETLKGPDSPSFPLHHPQDAGFPRDCQLAAKSPGTMSTFQLKREHGKAVVNK